MKILSLFDGCSMLRQALKQQGIQVDQYDASEIEPSSMAVSANHWPEINQLGSIVDLSFNKGDHYDLLVAGFSCQGFSKVGNKLNFDHPKSKLFFELERIMSEVTFDYFILENVKMKQEWMDVITSKVGVDPVLINSSRFWEQNRERLYWTNIPIDLSLLPDSTDTLGTIMMRHSTDLSLLKSMDVIPVEDRPVSPTGMIRCGSAHYKGHDYNRRVYLDSGKGPTLCASSGGNLEPKVMVTDYRDGTGVSRKLVPEEMERMQTLPSGYTQGVSNTARKRMIGNGFTVSVIQWILSQIPETGEII